MKILALSHSCVTDLNQQLFVALNKKPDVQIELIVPANWISDITGKPQTPRLLPSVDFPVHVLPVAIPGNVSLHFYHRLAAKRFQAFAPDLLLSTQESWSFSHFQAGRVARKLGIPIVFQMNQNILKHYPPPFRWLEQHAYRTAAAATACTEEARQVLLHKGLRAPSHIVPFGVDLTLFHQAQSAPLRRPLGLNGSLVVGYMGRFVPEKGLDTLIEAARMLYQEQPTLDFRVLLVGSGPGEDALRQQIAAAGLTDRFHFTGSIPHDQAGDYLRCMDIFVLPSRTTPSWKEQFGRVIIEALACGVPVVGSDSGQIPHLIRETKGGMVFAEGDASDLAQKLLALASDRSLRQEMGQNGSNSVQAKYTFEAVAGQLHRILTDILTDAAKVSCL